jgi:hypothetical protein
MREHKYSVLVSRVRIEHSRLTHGYLMMPVAEKVEPVCQVRHVLVESDGYDEHRWSSKMDHDFTSCIVY